MLEKQDKMIPAEAEAVGGVIKNVPLLGRNLPNDGVKSSTGGVTMKGFVQNIESITIKNKDFRQVLYTEVKESSLSHGFQISY